MDLSPSHVKNKLDEKVTKKAILEPLNKRLEILNTVQRRKLEQVGHVMSNPVTNNLPQSVIQDKRSRDRYLG